MKKKGNTQKNTT